MEKTHLFYNEVGSAPNMKHKKHSNFDSPSFFSGACEKCSEIYEANSKTDDLEGITFKCKKVLCQGRVTLGVGQSKSLSSKNMMPVPSEVTDNPSNPRRYC
jgi:hypothetical protein